MEYIDIKALGAAGDGVSDDSAVFNRAIKENEYIYIPEGEYLLGGTVRLTSDTHILASPLAHIKLAGGAQSGRYDFLVTNDDRNGNVNISITGGIWDGNCAENDRGNDLFDPTATTGVLFNFYNVKNLSVTDITLKNPLCYYMRFCRAENVKLENIRFLSDVIVANQDGIHLAGFCKNFTVRNFWGSYGSPNDDFLAFNADDCLTRQESFDVDNGPIENVIAENIYSEKCHCFVRLLSVDSAIENVTIRNISGDCKGTAVCVDAARNCRAPLFKDEDKPNGVGQIKNVTIENLAVTHSENPNAPFIDLMTNCESFTVRNFNALNDGPAIRIAKTCPHEMSFDGEKKYTAEVGHNEMVVIDDSSFGSFSFNRKDN